MRELFAYFALFLLHFLPQKVFSPAFKPKSLNFFRIFAPENDEIMAESPITILSRQRALLQTEYAYEKAEFQRMTEATGVKRKVERGLAWFPLSLGRSYHNSLDQLVVEVSKSATTS